MAKAAGLVDQWGRPVERGRLTEQVAAATIGGVRSPLTGYPADGLTPLRLADILREADAGDPVRYLELAETIEERNPHYVAVLGTRRRSVAQIEMTVEPASDAAEDVDRAATVRTWLERDELADEVFDILDCIGKGYSFTEITWETSEGQWMPARLDWRDPRWFRFERRDLATPVMLGDGGQELPLPEFRFIHATIRAKSGLPLRSGLARIAAWNWMFKAFTERDWAIFTQTYGQPLRVGKWGAGATEADKNTLFRAVANIAGDCAAIIPESMMIEFIETSSVGATSALYLERVKWLDEQMSKAVIGQTATTDAVTGGLGSGKEHRQVQEDIERADARALSAILNRDLVRPWMLLTDSTLRAFPKIKIARPEPEDTAALADTAEKAVRMGLRISARKTRERLGLDEPEDEADVLTAAKAPETPPADAPDGAVTDPAGRGSKIKRERGVFKRVEPVPGTTAARQPEGLSAALPRDPAPETILADRMEIEAAPAIAAMIGRIEAMVEAAGSMEELRAMLLAGFGEIDTAGLVEALELGFLGAHLQGRVSVLDGDAP